MNEYKRFDSYFDDYMQLWTVQDNENDNMLYPCTSENMANEFTKLLNELNNENQMLKKQYAESTEELDYYKSKCASLETGLFEADRENWKLKEHIEGLEFKLRTKENGESLDTKEVEDD